jgi:putative glutamine amidotransferase
MGQLRVKKITFRERSNGVSDPQILNGSSISNRLEPPMQIRIAIPEPTSTDAEYNSRSLPAYIAALQSSGATPIIVPLRESQDRVAKLLAGAQGVLLPGSRFDVDPERYGAARIPECGPADPGRTAVDELLLQDAFNLHKPVLAICHGMQTLNVWLNGSLIQDLNTELRTAVNHSPGREVINAHPIQIAKGSRMAGITRLDEQQMVNSSHHQALGRLGDRLRLAAASPEDGVVEAIELDSPEHFAMGVQWHPERTFAAKELSREIFKAFTEAVKGWRPATKSKAEQV